MFRGYYPHFKKNPNFVDIIAILWIFKNSVDIICISWKYPGYVDIICISWIYLHFVDTIGIDHIMRYLACNVRRILQSFVLVVDIIFGHITSCLARDVYPISHILLI